MFLSLSRSLNAELYLVDHVSGVKDPPASCDHRLRTDQTGR